MYYYNIHNIISVSLDENLPQNVIDDINFQIKYFQTDSKEQLKYKITIRNYSEFQLIKPKREDIFHLVKGNDGKIYHDPIKKFALEIQEDGYQIYSSEKSFLINFYIQLIFLKEGISMVHAAAVQDKDDNVILFPGPGGVGKTAIINYFIKELGYRTLGDDIIGIGKDGTCYAFPREFVLKSYHHKTYHSIFKEYGFKVKSQRRKRLNYLLNLVFYRLIFKNLPFTGLMQSLIYRTGFSKVLMKKQDFFTVPVEKIFGDGSVAMQGKLSQVTFLIRTESEGSITTITQERLSKVMYAIINHEWVDFSREIFSLGALEIIDFEEYMRVTHQIISESLGHVSTSLNLMKINNDSSPDDLVDQYLQRFN